MYQVKESTQIFSKKRTSQNLSFLSPMVLRQKGRKRESQKASFRFIKSNTFLT